MGFDFPINEHGNKEFLKWIKSDLDESTSPRLNKPLFISEAKTNSNSKNNKSRVSYQYPALEDFNSVIKQIADA